MSKSMTTESKELASEKWSVSTDEEHYVGEYESKEDAIEAGIEDAEIEQSGGFWIGRCMPPIQPEEVFRAEEWIDDVHDHEDYCSDWADGQFDPTDHHIEELNTEVRKVMSAWLDRHNLRPTHWIIEQASIRHVGAVAKLKSD